MTPVPIFQCWERWRQEDPDYRFDSIQIVFCPAFA
jgi:hypothetical protein